MPGTNVHTKWQRNVIASLLIVFHCAPIEHLLFKAFFGMIVLINVVDGCLPASLVAIDAEMHLSFAQEGALGGVVYLGLVVSSFLAGPLLQTHSVRKIIAFTCCAEGMFCCLFGLAPYVSILLLCRFAVGLSLGFSAVFAPVWVDEFAPKASQTMWMSMLQLSCPLGIMLGYMCGILTSTYGAGDVYPGWGQWRIPFVVQGALIVPLSLLMLLVPDEYLVKLTPGARQMRTSSVLVNGQASLVDHPSLQPIQDLPVQTLARRHRGSSNDSQTQTSTQQREFANDFDTSTPPTPLLQTKTSTAGDVTTKIMEHKRASSLMPITLTLQIKSLLQNKVYMFTVFGLSALYFVVTGIQFWITPYLVLDLGENVGVVGFCFVFSSATGPTLGVICGGYLVDRWGGYCYQGKAQAPIALKLCLGFVVVSVFCCLGAAFGRGLYAVMPMIWLLLFAGGAIVPPATGILMSCVHPQLKNLSSALATIIFNIFGYFLSPTLSGYVMEWTSSRVWGFRLVLGWSVFGAVALLFAWLYEVLMSAAERRAEKYHMSKRSEHTIIPIDGATPSTILSDHDRSETTPILSPMRPLSHSMDIHTPAFVKPNSTKATDLSDGMLQSGGTPKHISIDQDEDEDEINANEEFGYGGDIPDMQNISTQLVYSNRNRGFSMADMAMAVPALKAIMDRKQEQRHAMLGSSSLY